MANAVNSVLRESHGGPFNSLRAAYDNEDDRLTAKIVMTMKNYRSAKSSISEELKASISDEMKKLGQKSSADKLPLHLSGFGNISRLPVSLYNQR